MTEDLQAFFTEIRAELQALRAEVVKLRQEATQHGWGVLRTWDAIDNYMGATTGKMCRVHGPELRAAGVVHRRKEGPYQTNYVYALKSALDAWVVLKGRKGERI